MTQKVLTLTLVALGLSLLTGCGSDRPLRTPEVSQAIRTELQTPAAPKAVVEVPARISEALAEPAPAAVPLAPEPRLDLLVNNAQAREVFLAIVADTRYSMMMHPDVSGTLSVTLRGVTVTEALEAIRDVYGFDFKIDGRRITVYAPTLQTRIFTINYLNASRDGKSDLRVSSGAMPESSSGTGLPTQGGQAQTESSSVTTSSQTDLWEELTASVCSIIGAEAVGACSPKTKVSSNLTSNSQLIGNSTTKLSSTATRNVSTYGVDRRVTTSPQAGLMVVRALPEELREVEKFLKAAQLSVDRQVMLEAKIVEVELRDGYQSGIDWSALKNSGNSTGAMGVIGSNAPGPINSSATTVTSTNTLVRGVQSNLPGFAAGASLLTGGVSLPAAGNGLFGLAFATEGFQAVLGFLETQGDIQILSSPRIATLNNQKALLKVGTDEYYVTGFNPNASSGSTNNNTVGTNSSTPSTPLPQISSLFSGIALDVMPQIDANNNITLHVRPSVTSILGKNMQFSLGVSGNFDLTLASRSVNETDTIVRIQDGNIVAIGGLMQVESNRKTSGLPGTAEIGFLSNLFGNKANSGRKKEVVVLIKPSIIRNAQDWEAQTRRTREALDDMDVARSRVIRIDGSVGTLPSKNTAQ